MLIQLNQLDGRITLIMTPQSSEKAPMPKHHAFSSKDRGMHLSALPPCSTMNHWMAKVRMVRQMNHALLKKAAKTLNSLSPSLRALI